MYEVVCIWQLSALMTESSESQEEEKNNRDVPKYLICSLKSESILRQKRRK